VTPSQKRARDLEREYARNETRIARYRRVLATGKTGSLSRDDYEAMLRSCVLFRETLSEKLAAAVAELERTRAHLALGTRPWARPRT
jgi:hypothetical protein